MGERLIKRINYMDEIERRFVKKVLCVSCGSRMSLDQLSDIDGFEDWCIPCMRRNTKYIEWVEECIAANINTL